MKRGVVRVAPCGEAIQSTGPHRGTLNTCSASRQSRYCGKRARKTDRHRSGLPGRGGPAGGRSLSEGPILQKGDNFLVPEEGVEDLLWTDEAGTHLPQTASERLKTSEELPASDGTSWRAQYMATSVDRFTKSTHHVIHARAIIDCPAELGQTRIVPVKFKVWCDDLPDDVEARWETQELMLSKVALP